MNEKADEGNGNLSSTRRGNDRSGTPLIADFSAFCKMIREERDAARAEREAGSVAARAERERPRVPSSDG